MTARHEELEREKTTTRRFNWQSDNQFRTIPLNPLNFDRTSMAIREIVGVLGSRFRRMSGTVIRIISAGVRGT